MDMYMRRKCQECRLRKCKEMGMLAECECSLFVILFLPSNGDRISWARTYLGLAVLELKSLDIYGPRRIKSDF